jgi:hypothetical protein
MDPQERTCGLPLIKDSAPEEPSAYPHVGSTRRNAVIH